MDQQAFKHIYLIGPEQGIKQCLETLTGDPYDIGGIVTDLESVRLGREDVPMEDLKVHRMECENSLGLDEQSFQSSKRSVESASFASPKMKRLKSLESRGYSPSDVGYESDTTESEDSKETRSNICAIIVEDDEGLHKHLASFVFATLIWPALILIPIGGGISNYKLYAEFITELGMYASEKKEQSKLVLVENSTQSEKEKKDRVNLECEITDSYFGENIGFCKLDNLFSKVTDFVHGTFTGGLSTSQNVKLESDRTMLKSHELVNNFRRMLIEVLNRPPVLCTIIISTYITIMNDTLGEKLPMKALANLSLIHEQGHKGSKLITLMPFICSEYLPEFEKRDYHFDTNHFKMEFNLETIPTYLRARIFKILLDKGWSVMSSGPECCKEDSVLFSKESHRLLIRLQLSYRNTLIICFYGLRKGERSECSESANNLAARDYNDLRESVESELKIRRDGGTSCNETVKYYAKLKDDKDIETVIKDEDHWQVISLKKLDPTIASNITGYLFPWFSSEISNVEKEFNQQLNDSVLSDLSSLFGKWYNHFFLSQGIPNELLEQIILENPGRIKDQVIKMLQEWRKMKGTDGNLAVLKLALKESEHVMINLNKFDEIVNKHKEPK